MRLFFEKDCVYIIPLRGRVELTGKHFRESQSEEYHRTLDIFTRLIADYGTEFDHVPPGYKGKLYAEVVSRTFTVAIRAGMRLSQLRFVQGSARSSDRAIKGLDREEPLVYMDEDSP